MHISLPERLTTGVDVVKEEANFGQKEILIEVEEIAAQLANGRKIVRQ